MMREDMNMSDFYPTPLAAGDYGIGEFKVTPDELKSISGQVSADVVTVKGRLDALERIVSSFPSFWSGDAADSFRDTYSGYKDETEEIIARISEHVTDLEKMAGVYSTAEVSAESVVGDLPDEVIL